MVIALLDPNEQLHSIRIRTLRLRCISYSKASLLLTPKVEEKLRWASHTRYQEPGPTSTIRPVGPALRTPVVEY
jgi:hypothetical protein